MRTISLVTILTSIQTASYAEAGVLQQDIHPRFVFIQRKKFFFKNIDHRGIRFDRRGIFFHNVDTYPLKKSKACADIIFHRCAGLTGEAEKQAAILRAEAEKEKMIKEAEGQAQAILTVQQANADGIRFLKEAGADDAVLTMKSLEAFEKAADGKATKIIIPSEIQGIAGLVKSLTEVGAKEEDTK